MALLIFVVAVLISLIDPLLAVAYVGAGVMAPNWRWAMLYGPIAGMAMLVLLALLLGGGWQPKPYNLAAQILGCQLGAVAVRLVIDLVRRRRASVA